MIRKLILILILLCICCVTVVMLFFNLHKPLIIEQKKIKPDLIIALASLTHRLDWAALEYQRLGPCPVLTFYPKEKERILGVDFDVPKGLRRHLHRRGVDSSHIHINGPVSSTYEEAMSSSAFLQRFPDMKNIIVVTTAFHSARTEWIFARILGTEREVAISYYPLEWDEMSLQEWWTREDELLWVFQEWIKTILYRLKY